MNPSNYDEETLKAALVEIDLVHSIIGRFSEDVFDIMSEPIWMLAAIEVSIKYALGEMKSPFDFDDEQFN